MKINFNHKSIKVKTLGYFLFFAGALIVVMWFLQVFFLTNYYEEMKVKETEKAAYKITAAYKNEDFKGLVREIRKVTSEDDILVKIESLDENLIYNTSPGVSAFAGEIEAVKNKLLKGSSRYVSVVAENKINGRNTLVFARVLDDATETILVILSPLYPVSSTIKILQSQLVFISLIALALSLILSFFLSSKISTPIQSITRSAKKLGDGQYGITFRTDSEYSEIENLANALNKASSELDKATTLQKDLIANVSHDLRTPLTMVKSYAEMVRDLSGNNPVKRNEHLNVIIEEADRLNTLVSDMLAISTLQSQGIVLDIKPFDASAMIASILHTYEILESKEGYHIKLNCKNSIIVSGDEERIKQVASNLITNAIKYCGDDKTVIVNLKKIGRKTRFEVVDHGPGIEPDEIPRIWERYYKASSNLIRETVGSGLGLSITKEILTLHKAKFGVESRVGKGSTFWFEI